MDPKENIPCPMCGKTAIKKTYNATEKRNEYKHSKNRSPFEQIHQAKGRYTETTYCYEELK